MNQKMENKANTGTLSPSDDKTLVRVFNRSENPVKSGIRVKNTLKTKHYLDRGFKLREIAEKLGVNIRSVCRYKKLIDETSLELFIENTGGPDPEE